MVPRVKHMSINDRVTFKDDHWTVVGVVDDEPTFEAEEGAEHVQYVVAKRMAGSFVEKRNILHEDIQEYKSRSSIVHEERMAKLQEMKEDGTMERLTKEFAEDMSRKESAKQLHVARVMDFLETLDDETFEAVVKRFFEWEEKYEEMWYTKRHTQTCSRLFSMIVNIWEEEGEWVERYEMFTHGGFIHRGYEIQTHCGQGCFHRVLKDGEIVFQTT